MPMFKPFCLVLLCVTSFCLTEAFHVGPRLTRSYRVRRVQSSTQLSMQILDHLQDNFASSTSLSPLDTILLQCITASSKTTVTDDPLAGMDQEQIDNYLSNIGGGMCGFPDSIRTAIGIGLNFSFIGFGVVTVSYCK